jgi:hypothetical protein
LPERIPEHIARLLASSIESVERLDILFHLRATPKHAFSAKEVATQLHMPTHAVEQHLAILCGRGFLTVSIANDLLYSFRPVSPAIAEALNELEEIKRARRADVIAALEARDGKDPVRAFANAFLIRGKKGGNDA